MSAVGKQSAKERPIVQASGTILLVGGANVSQSDINKCLSHTDQCVAADGGADTLRAFGLVPRAVIGDLDSLTAAARHDFALLLHEVTDQSQTDFEKTLLAVSAPVILALGFLGGRLDHTLATLNVLIRHAQKAVVLVGSDDIAFAVSGTVQIDLPPGTPLALLPMSATRTTTQGLRWNLDGAVLAPDGLVSSSNAATGGRVEVQTDQPLIVTLPVSALPVAIDAVRAK